MAKYEIIDTNTWIRKSQFDFFSTFLNPDYGFNKKIDVTGFTTPGDVRDFAIDNGGIKKDNQGRLVIIPMS